jgi:hypothetical protein
MEMEMEMESVFSHISGWMNNRVMIVRVRRDKEGKVGR